MEQLKKSRSVLRAMFTRQANTLDGLLKTGSRRETLQEIEASWAMLQEKYQSLKVADKQIFDAFIEDDCSEEELTAELTSCDEYNTRHVKLSIVCNKVLHPREELSTVRNIGESQGGFHKFKLPTIELKKFGGDVKDWLPFWCQFKRIHEDDDMALEDKFQYLFQAMLPGSRARALLESFPPTGENYEKAIDSLKSRFGRDDILVEVYVRELLKIVLNNVSSSNSKFTLAILYDKIETQLRALETLGITTDKCAAMLYPLVESCLPEDLIRAWQRSSEFSANHTTTLKERLDGIIKFLKNEVESEERISLAVDGFGLHSHSRENKYKKNKMNTDEFNPLTAAIPTAAGLLTHETSKCIFCDATHRSTDCFKARKLSLDQKREILIKKRACFRCLKIGHQNRKCRERISCTACNGPHFVLLCPDTPLNKNSNKSKSDSKPENVEKSLANYTDTHVFLQTLRLIIRNGLKTREVRAIIDTGSQRSYVLQSTATNLNYVEKRREKIVHTLFGGMNTTEYEHSCFDIRLLSKDKKYACTFEVLDQPVICNRVSSVFEGSWTDELKKLKISMTDVRDAGPIELLIGADVAGKLLTGRQHILTCGLVAVETFLGWTLMGKIPSERYKRSTTMTTTSLLMSDAEVPDRDESDSISLNKRMRFKQKLREDLRSRFRNEYLGQIRQISGTKKRHNISVGEIVLIGDDINKRIVGRVVELLPGKDGRTRLVRIQTQNGQLLRPIQRLYSLECTNEDSVSAGVI